MTIYTTLVAILLISTLTFGLTSCLTCLSCNQISQPRHCRYVETCNMDEVCGTKMELSVAGYFTYTLGCMPNKKCSNTTASPFCSECCSNGNLCNAALCGEPDFPAKRGPICFDCQFHTGAQPCRRIDFCAEHEDCSILGVEEFGDLSLTSACKPKHVCLATSYGAFLGRRSADHKISAFRAHHNPEMTTTKNNPSANRLRSASHVMCETCCSQDLCNLGCPGVCGSATCVNGFCNATTSGAQCACHAGWVGSRCDQVTNLPTDCSELHLVTQSNGSYTIYPYGSANVSVSVYCEFNFDGVWTVIQKRFDGSVDFYKNWAAYKKGFGTSSGEYWIGNDIIHQLTSTSNYKMKIVLKDWSDIEKFATYNSFSIAGESDNYRLSIQGYTGTAGDSMLSSSAGGPHNGMQFTTLDADHDTDGNNCAISYHGSWWYKNCYDANLNGQYHQSYSISSWHGIVWNAWHGSSYSLKATRMMIQKN